MDKIIPRISDEMMEWVEKLFYHGESRARNHDQRLGQWIMNELHTKYKLSSREDATRILFNMENQELWDLMKGYNE